MTMPTRKNSQTFIASPALTFTSIDTEMEVINGIRADQTNEATTTETVTGQTSTGPGQFLHPAAESNDSSRIVPIDGKIYRFDNQHQKFQPSEPRIEPRIHVSVKAKSAGELIALESLADHQNALRISQGAGIEPIVVSQFDSIDISNLDISQLVQTPSSTSGSRPETATTPAQQLDPITEPVTAVQSDLLPLSICSVTTYDQLTGTSQDEPITPQASVETVIHPDEVAQEFEVAQELEQTELESATVKTSSPSHAADDPADMMDEHWEPIIPAWEVSRFRWPAVINNLSAQHKPAFRRLLDSLQVNLNEQQTSPQRIGVIHSRTGQGATTLATCLAKILADSAKVLLVDLDWASPNLEETANIKLQHGWQELDQSDQPLSEYLVRETASGITLMPLRRETDLAAKTPRLLAKIKEISPKLTSQFDYSLFDIGNAKNLMITENCHVGFLDAAVIVSDSCGDDSFAISIYEQLIAAGVPSVVIAENFRQKSRSVA